MLILGLVDKKRRGYANEENKVAFVAARNQGNERFTFMLRIAATQRCFSPLSLTQKYLFTGKHTN